MTVATPQIPMHIWRPLHPLDTPALRQLLTDCAPFDGDTAPETVRHVDNLETDTTAAIDNAGRIAAYAWLRFHHAAHQARVFIDGRVHPDYRQRGIGRYLLTWSESRARAMLAKVPRPDHEKMLRIDFYDRDDRPARALFERMGYHFAFGETEMHRPLDKLPPRPTHYTYHTYTPGFEQDFYETYVAAFRDRPGFPNWSQAVWVTNFTDWDDFRPDLSLLLLMTGEPVAFAVCHQHEDDPDLFVITQTGVRDDARRRGYGTALLTEVMYRGAAAGFSEVMLEVNLNNPAATALYETLDFVPIRTYTSYQKPYTDPEPKGTPSP